MVITRVSLEAILIRVLVLIPICFRFGLVPYRKPIHVVVGTPIKVKKIENPTREEIESMHETYVKELQKLYDKYNPIYGDVNVKLVIE